MRHERRSQTMEGLGASLNDMITVVERNRHSGTQTVGSERKLKECVTVMVWEEVDGTETIEVLGQNELPPLAAKGVLHDGLFALANGDV